MNSKVAVGVSVNGYSSMWPCDKLATCPVYSPKTTATGSSTLHHTHSGRHSNRKWMDGHTQGTLPLLNTQAHARTCTLGLWKRRWHHRTRNRRSKSGDTCENSWWRMQFMSCQHLHAESSLQNGKEATIWLWCSWFYSYIIFYQHCSGNTVLQTADEHRGASHSQRLHPQTATTWTMTMNTEWIMNECWVNKVNMLMIANMKLVLTASLKGELLPELKLFNI